MEKSVEMSPKSFLVTAPAALKCAGIDLSKKLSFVLSCCFLLVSISGCNTPAPKGETDPQDAASEPASGVESVVILGTNDIHGTLGPLKLKTREAKGVPPVPYDASGGAVLASYVRILKAEFGDHFLWLDGGDEFQGSVESNMDYGKPVVQFMNEVGLHAAAVGNHEFDFGIKALSARMSEAKYPYLAANIWDKKTNQPASFPNTLPHAIFKAGKLKIGVIGLSTEDTPVTTLAVNVESLRFESLKEATLREAQILRSKGAHIVLLVAHSGLKCEPGDQPENRRVRKITDGQGSCDERYEMFRLLNSIPKGILDGVVSGHTHTIIHHWVAGIPVIQGGAFGRYVNVIYLKYDWAQRRVLADEALIEGPVPVCEKVFQNQGDCWGDRPAPKVGRGPLVQAKFHGQAIVPDPVVSRQLKDLLDKSEVKKNQVIGKAASALDVPRTVESPLGNLIADAIREAAGADFAMINSGGIRAPLEEGAITYGQVFRSLPFENTIAVLKLTVDELRLLLRVAQSGARGFASVSGLQLDLIDPSLEGPFSDLNGDGKLDYWEMNRLLDLRLSNKQPLQSHRYYTLATVDFLITGGDDLGWPISQIPKERVTYSTGKGVRDAIVSWIQKKGIVNTERDPMIEPTNPRLRFLKTFVQDLKKGMLKAK